MSQWQDLPPDLGHREFAPKPPEYKAEPPDGASSGASGRPRVGVTTVEPPAGMAPAPRPLGMGGPAAPRGPSRQDALVDDIEGAQKREFMRKIAERDLYGRTVDQELAQRDRDLARQEELAKYEQAQLEQQQAQTRRIEEDTRVLMDEWQREESEADKMKVDPNRIWSGDGGGARKAMAMLGAAIWGGLLAMDNPGGRNPVLDQINAAMDRDIRLQEMEIEKARQKGQRAKVRLEEYTQRFGSPEAAKAALKSAMYGQMVRESDLAAAKSQSPVIQQRAADAKSAFEREQARAADQAMVARNAAELQALEAQRMAAMRGGGASRPKVSKGELSALEKEMIEKERTARDVAAIDREYAYWQRNPPQNAEERARAADAVARKRASYWSNTLGRQDAPSGEEAAQRDAVVPMPGPTSTTGRVLDAVLPDMLIPESVKPSEGTREGAAKATEASTAKARREADEARARFEAAAGKR